MCHEYVPIVFIHPALIKDLVGIRIDYCFVAESYQKVCSVLLGIVGISLCLRMELRVVSLGMNRGVPKESR